MASWLNSNIKIKSKQEREQFDRIKQKLKLRTTVLCSYVGLARICRYDPPLPGHSLPSVALEQGQVRGPRQEQERLTASQDITLTHFVLLFRICRFVEWMRTVFFEERMLLPSQNLQSILLKFCNKFFDKYINPSLAVFIFVKICFIWDLVDRCREISSKGNGHYRLCSRRTQIK